MKPSDKLKVLKFKSVREKTLKRLSAEPLSTLEDNTIPGIDHFSKVTGGGMFQFYRLYDKGSAKEKEPGALPTPNSIPKIKEPLDNNSEYVRLVSIQPGNTYEKKFFTTNEWEYVNFSFDTLPNISDKYETLKNYNNSWVEYLGTPKYGNLETYPGDYKLPYKGYIYSLTNKEELDQDPKASIRIARHEIEEYGNLFSFVVYGKYKFPLTTKRAGESPWYPDRLYPEVKHFNRNGLISDFNYNTLKDIVSRYLSEDDPKFKISRERLKQLATEEYPNVYNHVVEFAFCLRFRDPLDPSKSLDKHNYTKSPTVDELITSPLLANRLKSLDFSIFSGQEGKLEPTYEGIYILYKMNVKLQVEPIR